MRFWETVKKRKLSIAGVFLILIATTGLIRDGIIISNLQPILGSIEQIRPYLKTELPEPMPTYVIVFYELPFLMTGIIGGILILIDFLMKRRKETHIPEVS